MIKATRYHDFSYGHRVVGHGNKCSALHGHNGRVHFTCAAPKLNDLGMVIDFGIIKSTLCQWVEDNWDHKFLVWDKDKLMRSVAGAYADYSLGVEPEENRSMFLGSMVWLPFNPTAENMADYLLNRIGPELLRGHDAELIKVKVQETAKCSATCEK